MRKGKQRKSRNNFTEGEPCGKEPVVRSRNNRKIQAIDEAMEDLEEEKMDTIEEIIGMGHVCDVNDEGGFVNYLLKMNGITKQDLDRYMRKERGY